MRSRSALACCLACTPCAAHAGSHRYLPLAFDLHETRSAEIAGLKAPPRPQLSPRPSLRPEPTVLKPRIRIYGNRLKFSIHF